MAKLVSIKGVFSLFLLSAILYNNEMSAEAKVPTGSQKFAQQLYQNCVAEKGGNVIISPYSVETALSLAYMGARGSTATEMAKGLEYASEDRNAVAAKFETSSGLYKSGSPVSIANKVFVMEGHTVKRAFNDLATKSFNSEAQNLDFSKSEEAARTINTWVEQKTNDKIKDLVSKDSLDGLTRMVLVNAIYFKGLWQNKFKEADTKKADFFTSETEKQQVDMMKTKAQFKYGVLSDLDATAIEMPYQNSNLSMLVILPNKKDGLPALEKAMLNVDLSDVTSKMYSQEVTVYFPKFKVEYDLKLNEPLKKMGMTTMFSDAADFGDLLDSPEPLKVSEVVHKAFIEVNEEGTEAAAATELGVVPLSLRLDTVFRADQAFHYRIIGPRRRILFMGSYVARD